MQQAKRATIIGEASYGVMGSSTSDYELIDGGALYITNRRSIAPDGKPLPERVQPDLIVTESLEQILGQDLMLQAIQTGVAK